MHLKPICVFFLITLHLVKEEYTIYLNDMSTPLPHSYSLNLGGRLYPLDKPLVMGILNATQESFYATSRSFSAEAVRVRVETMLAEGAHIIDVGACSTKPGLVPIDEVEEMRRLNLAFAIIRDVAPDAIVSVDTFRASVAEWCVKEYGVQIINDVAGGELDDEMFDTVARLQVPYILTHSCYSNTSVNNSPTAQCENLWQKMMYSLAERISRLHLMGVNDIIVDPGFGFGKTLDDNYHLLAHLEELHLLGCPLLTGVSRKSMIYNLLNCTPEEALNGTTVLHTIALMKGTHILRVHDVRAAVEVVKITEKLKSSSDTKL